MKRQTWNSVLLLPCPDEEADLEFCINFNYYCHLLMKRQTWNSVLLLPCPDEEEDLEFCIITAVA